MTKTATASNDGAAWSAENGSGWVGDLQTAHAKEFLTCSILHGGAMVGWQQNVCTSQVKFFMNL